MSKATNSVRNEIQMDRVAINDIANSTVRESTIARNFSEAMAELRFHGEIPIGNVKELDTPVAKRVKRSCTVLIPVNEANPYMNSEKRTDSSIKRSTDNLVPCILETIRTELRITISDTIDAELIDLRNELDDKVNLEAAKSELQTFSESELLETYNRKDNIKQLGLSPCSTESKENYQQTWKLVFDVVADIGIYLKKEDVSIAHRLPSNSERKPMTAKFLRRVIKLDFKKKKEIWLNRTSTKASKYLKIWAKR